jgi:hypothetical protein
MDNNKSKNVKECEKCKSNATCLCFICNNYYCENCYKVIHDLEKNKNHKKEKIDPFVPIDLKCQKHPQDGKSLFCTNEKGKSIISLIL